MQLLTQGQTTINCFDSHFSVGSNQFVMKRVKVMYILFLAGSGVTVNAVHPGVVSTEITRHFWFLKFILPVYWFVSYLFFKTPIQGAQSTIYCAIAEELTEVSGQYIKDCQLAKCSEKAKDEGVAKKLEELSEQLTGISAGH